MKPTMTPHGLWSAPVAGARLFRTRQEAQEYCDFIEPPAFWRGFVAGARKAAPIALVYLIVVAWAVYVVACDGVFR